MDSTWPNTVVDFERFLSGAGFVCQHRKELSTFSNKIIEYANSSVGVRVVSDRGIWFVEVADILNQPKEWYDAAILRDLVLGPGEDVLPLPEQIQIIKENLPTIVRLFDPSEREVTLTRLNLLRKERAKRRFPGIEFST
jgi:hypothetical protein